MVVFSSFFFFLMIRRPQRSTQLRTLFPYTTLFRSLGVQVTHDVAGVLFGDADLHRSEEHTSELQSPSVISYAVFCLKKKTQSSDRVFALLTHHTVTALAASLAL